MIRPSIRICTKSYRGLFCSGTHLQSEFRGNLLSSFCAIVLRTQPNKRTEADENIQRMSNPDLRLKDL